MPTTYTQSVGESVTIIQGEYVGCRAWLDPDKAVNRKSKRAPLLVEITTDHGVKKIKEKSLDKTSFKPTKNLLQAENMLGGEPKVLKAVREAAGKVAKAGYTDHKMVGDYFGNVVNEKVKALHNSGHYPVPRGITVSGGSKGSKNSRGSRSSRGSRTKRTNTGDNMYVDA